MSGDLMTSENFAPCPTCGQYSRSIGADDLAEAHLHFETMIAHPVSGHAMGHAFDDTTRDMAQRVIAEITRLRAEVERLTVNGVHSCHDQCERPVCVLRRENEALRAELASLRSTEGEGWRPIEAAPRDGTWVIVDGGGCERPAPMKFNTRVGAWECDAVMLEDWDDQAEGYSRPTRWLPIYAQPTPDDDVTGRLVEALEDIANHWGDCEQGPGHSHAVPGIWDSDNRPAIAGTPCEWCGQWARARQALADARKENSRG